MMYLQSPAVNDFGSVYGFMFLLIDESMLPEVIRLAREKYPWAQLVKRGATLLDITTAQGLESTDDCSIVLDSSLRINTPEAILTWYMGE